MAFDLFGTEAVTPEGTTEREVFDVRNPIARVGSKRRTNNRTLDTLRQFLSDLKTDAQKFVDEQADAVPEQTRGLGLGAADFSDMERRLAITGRAVNREIDALTGAFSALPEDTRARFIPDLGEMTPGEQIFERGVTEVARAAPFIAGGGALATGRIGQQILRGGAQSLPTTTQRTLGTLVEPFAQAPGATAALETGIASLAGTAAGVSQVEFPGDADKETAALIAGGLGPAAIAMTAKTVVSPLVRRFGIMTEAESRKVVSDILHQGASESNRAIDEISAFVDDYMDDAGNLIDLHGVRPTTRDVIGAISGKDTDAGISALTEKLAKETKVRGRFDEQKRVSEEVIEGVFEDIMPLMPPGVDGKLVKSEIRAHADGLLGRIDQRMAEADENIQRILDGMGVPASRSPIAVRKVKDDASELIATELKEAEKTILTPIKEKFDSLSDQIIDAAKLKNDMGLLAKQMKKDSVVKDIPHSILSQVQKLDASPTFAALRALRSLAGRKAVEHAKSGERELSRNYWRVKEVLTESGVNEMGRKGGAQAVAALRYKEAVGEFLTFAKSRGFRERTVDKILKQTGAGTVKVGDKDVPIGVAPTAVAGRFWKSGIGSREAAEDFVNAFGKSRPRANEALEEYAANDLFQMANKDGQLTLKGLKDWEVRFAAQLDEFPAVKKKFNSLVKAQKTMEHHLGRRIRTQDSVNKSALRFAMNDRNPETLWRDIMRTEDPVGVAKDLMRRGGLSKDAKAGLKTMFFEHMSNVAGGGAGVGMRGMLRRPDKGIQQFNMPQNQEILKTLGFSQGDIDRNIQILKAANVIRRTQLTGQPSVSLDTNTDILPLPLTALLSRFYALERGIIGPRFVGSELGARFLKRFFDSVSAKHTVELLDEALRNPVVARNLMNTVKHQNQAAGVVKRLRLHMLNAGRPLTEEDQEMRGPDKEKGTTEFRFITADNGIPAPG